MYIYTINIYIYIYILIYGSVEQYVSGKREVQFQIVLVFSLVFINNLICYKSKHVTTKMLLLYDIVVVLAIMHDAIKPHVYTL